MIMTKHVSLLPLHAHETRTLGRYRMQKFEGHRRAVFAVQLADEHLYSSSFDNTIKVGRSH